MRELREVLSSVPSFLPPSHQVLCGKAMAVLWEEALGWWKEMKSGQVQGKQGTERRQMMAAEADLDPKSMLRSLRRFLVISPHATVGTWRTGVHLPHAQPLPAHLNCPCPSPACPTAPESVLLSEVVGKGEWDIAHQQTRQKHSLSPSLSAQVSGVSLPSFLITS